MECEKSLGYKLGSDYEELEVRKTYNVAQNELVEMKGLLFSGLRP